MPGNEDHKLDDRLGHLDAELAKMRESQATKNRAKMDSEQSNGLAMAWRLGSEFVAGVLVGTAIGWLIDEWLGIRPWGMIIFLLARFPGRNAEFVALGGQIAPSGSLI